MKKFSESIKSCLNVNATTYLTKKRFCVNCRNHGVKIIVSGHKNNCLYQQCVCPLCLLSGHVKTVSVLERKNHRQMESNKNEKRKATSDQNGKDKKNESLRTSVNTLLDETFETTNFDAHLNLNEFKDAFLKIDYDLPLKDLGWISPTEF